MPRHTKPHSIHLRKNNITLQLVELISSNKISDSILDTTRPFLHRESRSSVQGTWQAPATAIIALGAYIRTVCTQGPKQWLLLVRICWEAYYQCRLWDDASARGTGLCLLASTQVNLKQTAFCPCCWWGASTKGWLASPSVKNSIFRISFMYYFMTTGKVTNLP